MSDDLYTYRIPPENINPPVRQHVGLYFGTKDQRGASLYALVKMIRTLIARKPSLITVRIIGADWKLSCRCKSDEPNAELESWLNTMSEVSADGHPCVSSEAGHIVITSELDPTAFENPAPIERARVVGVVRPLALASPEIAFSIEETTSRTDLQYATPSCLALELGGGRSHRLLDPWPINVGDSTRRIRAGLWWAQDGGRQVFAVVNGHHTAHGGTHIRGFWEALAAAICQRAVETGFDAPSPNDFNNDIEWPATLVLDVTWPEPVWGPATRCCLNDPSCGAFAKEQLVGPLLKHLRRFDPAECSAPWQMLGGVHWPTPWLARLSKDFTDAA